MGDMKSPDAFKTISEVAEDLDLPQHVLRFWETRFKQVQPMKRGGGRRYYRPDDVELLSGIKHLLYSDGYTIKGVQRLLKERGVGFVSGASDHEDAQTPDPSITAEPQKAASVADMKKRSASRAPANSSIDPLQSALSELLECKRILDQVR